MTSSGSTAVERRSVNGQQKIKQDPTSLVACQQKGMEYPAANSVPIKKAWQLWPPLAHYLSTPKQETENENRDPVGRSPPISSQSSARPLRP